MTDGPGLGEGEAPGSGLHLSEGTYMSQHYEGCKWHGHEMRHQVPTMVCLCGQLAESLGALNRVTEERDRARAIAVALEQEIDQCTEGYFFHQSNQGITLHYKK